MPLTGSPRPRLQSWPPSVGSAGPEAVALAATAGLVLDPWQAWLLERSLAERAPDGRWASFEVALIVSRQNGKNAVLEARELAGLFLFGEELIIHTAHQFKTSTEAFRRIRRLIESVPDFDRRVMKITESHGEEGIELLGGQRLRFVARSGSSGRGFTADLLVYDEAMILDSAAARASLPALSALPNPQVWYTASAGIGKQSTQLARVRRRGIRGGDARLGFAEWSIDGHRPECPHDCREHDDPADPRSWAKSNPSLGVARTNHTGLTIESIERERDALDAAGFAGERLGVGDYPAAGDDWDVIPKRLWDARMTRDTARPSLPCFAIDTRPDRGATAIGLAGSLGGGLVKVELAEHRAGIGWAVGRAAELDREHGPLAWVVDKRAAAGALVTDLELAGLNVIIPTATEVGHACGQFYDAVIEETLRHSGEKALNTALGGAEKRALGGQWAWDRSAGGLDLSPLYAFTLAHWGHLKLAPDGDYAAADSVGFGLAEIQRMFEAGHYGPHDIRRLFDMGALNLAGAKVLAGRGIIPEGAVAALAAADN